MSPPLTPADQAALHTLRTLWPDLLPAAEGLGEALESADLVSPEVREAAGALLELLSRLYDVRHSVGPETESKRHRKFWARIVRPENLSGAEGLAAPCWTATFAKTQSGPVASWDGKLQPVVRIVWQLLRGEAVPASDQLKRQCQTFGCVNPAHFERQHRNAKVPRTLKNPEFREALDKAVKGERLCRSGHALPLGKKARDCAECRAARRAEKRQAQTAEWYGQVDHLAAQNGYRQAPEAILGGVERASHISTQDAADDADIEVRIAAMFAGSGV